MARCLFKWKEGPDSFAFWGVAMAIKARGDELTAADAAMALRVSHHAVLRWLQTRRLKGSRRGGIAAVIEVSWPARCGRGLRPADRPEDARRCGVAERNAPFG